MTDTTPGATPVLLFCANLMYRIELKGLLEAQGVQVTSYKSLDSSAIALPPSIRWAVVDLEGFSENTALLIQTLLSRFPESPVLCFYSHRDLNAADLAQAAGASLIVTRSGLHEALAELLDKY